MDFFTTQDVLDRASAGSPEEPETISVDASIQRALELMFDNNFSQLPVEADGRISGAISYRSISRVLKSFDDTGISQQSVGIALEEPEFVERDRDIYDLFETLAEDDYVLVGTPDNLQGIMTRYDVFFFLEDQVRPFLLIGDIETALRQLFATAFKDVDHQIEQTFADRSEHDDSYTPPERLEKFNYWEYQTFISTNWETLGEYFTADKDFVVDMIDDLGKIRNALFHFREAADSVDRDLVELAHMQVLEARQRARQLD